VELFPNAASGEELGGQWKTGSKPGLTFKEVYIRSGATHHGWGDHAGFEDHAGVTCQVKKRLAYAKKGGTAASWFDAKESPERGHLRKFLGRGPWK